MVGPPRFELGCPPPQGERMVQATLRSHFVFLNTEVQHLIYKINMHKEHPPAAISFQTKVVKDVLGVLADHPFRVCLVKMPYGLSACKTSYWNYHRLYLYDFCFLDLAPCDELFGLCCSVLLVSPFSMDLSAAMYLSLRSISPVKDMMPLAIAILQASA